MGRRTEIMSWAAVIAVAAGSLSPATGDAVVRVPDGPAIKVNMPGGYCWRLPGPAAEEKTGEAAGADPAALQLGAWGAQEHLLCMSDATDEAVVTVSPELPATDPGDFGFGEGVAVGLRPRVQTSALWPLQAKTPSLGVPFRGEAARLVAIQASVNAQMMMEFPLVAVQFRRWPIDVAPVNPTAGSCRPEAVPGANRMACRLANAKALELVVFCRPCAQHSATMQILGKTLRSTDAPWLGLTAHGKETQQWEVTVRQYIDGQEEVQDFVIAAVLGESDVEWRESGAQRRIRLLGNGLMQATLVAAVAGLVLLRGGFGSGGSSGPTALVPGLAATALSVPYLALLSQASAPSLLQSAFGSQIFSLRPAVALAQAMLALLAVLALHGYAATRFLQANGPGAAEVMPHGLSFGAWELRAVTYLAVPVSAAAAKMAAFCHPSASFLELVVGLLGCLIMLGLLALPWQTMRKLRELFQESKVICLQHPDTGHLQYVDRVCDQLHAVPFKPKSRLLGSWSESSSWQYSPPVATVRDLEYRGTCKERAGDPWDRTWSLGPWCEESSNHVRTPISEGMRLRTTSLDSTFSIEQPLMQSGKWKPAPSQSSLLGSHPVTVTTRFAFSGRFGVAGVAGLPWLDVAVPADALKQIEQCMANIRLRVQASQLAGPITCGRFSACFEATHRKPWWWAYDVLLKVAAGCTVALAPELTAQRPVLQVSWLLAMLAMATWVACVLPHVHFVENLAAACGAFAAPLGTAFYLFGHQVQDPQTAQVAAAGVLLFAYLPALLALAASLCLLRCSSDRAEALDQVPGWGELSGARIGAPSGYLPLLCEDDSPPRGKVAPSETAAAQAELHLADGVLLSIDPTKACRVNLPCEVKSPLSPVHLWMKGAVAVSSSLSDRAVKLALPLALLRGDAPDAAPLAALLTPESGLLLYRDQELNGGLKWQEALQRFLGDQPALLREARKHLSEEGEHLMTLEILE
ncbi:unnamed protein product [Effrenium voratum]|uniref:Uncharacterized protein n=1 Tax=Effrenium voratum TaxID=2562239 RepID=A0AA36IN88_9DINO|nr:unnamed protein product [Effrenium voratum]